MPGVAQSVSMNVWYEISQIRDRELRELAEKIFRLYDDNKFAEFGALFVWVLCVFGAMMGLSAVGEPNALSTAVFIGVMLGAIWPAHRYYQWRRRLSDQKYEAILGSHPKAPQAARLVQQLYRQSHPFG